MFEEFDITNVAFISQIPNHSHHQGKRNSLQNKVIKMI
jgi:hypothetical protein